MKVQVYYNLHTHKWSIRDGKSKLVVGYADSIILQDVKPLVSQSGRERVLRDREKNVHAYLCGTIVHASGFTSYKGRNISYNENTTTKSGLVEITYNPYKYTTFVIKSTLEKVKHMGHAFLNNDRTVHASEISVDNCTN